MRPSKNKAYVTLQENNALAIINIEGGTVEKIVALGLNDHSLPENELDASDTDNGINIAPGRCTVCISRMRPRLRQSTGWNYLITANEGDAA